MLRDFGLLLVFFVTGIATVSEARSGNEVNLQNVNVTCEPTKCPKICPTESGGHFYYFETNTSCLKCRCGRPKGPADCGEDTNPSLCNSVAMPEECKKNSTVRQSCKFSCSQSGQLWWAASEGILHEVNTAIATGANPLCQRTFTKNFWTEYPNMTALHLAALHNNPGVAVAILDTAVDVNLQTTQGRTPIYYASRNDNIDVLNVLIEHNADVNIAASDGETPLIGAANEGHLSIVKALVYANASLDVTGGWHNATALYYAASGFDPDIALLLIEHNANVNIAASDSKTPLMEAAERGRLSVVKALINANASLDVTGGGGDSTALYYAVKGNNQDIALLLVEHNADVNIVASKGETPLMGAAYKGHLNLTKALVNANASLDVTGGPDNATALYYAIKGKNEDIALLLIEHNAENSMATNNGMTPLMVAAWLGWLSEVKGNIDANANLNVKGGWENATALYYAIYGYNLDIALLLIEHNADVNIAASDEQTPLMEAAQQDQLNVAKALINANASLDLKGGWANATALYWAVDYHNPDIVSLLIEHNADVNIAGRFGRTPLMEAAESGQLNVTKALINANANLDVTGGVYEATALYYAARYNNPDIALLLIEHNADINIAASNGETPLMRAAEWGYLNVAKVLINANASLDVTGGWDNATALHYAAKRDSQDVALLLLQSGADTMIQDEDGQTPADRARFWENYKLANIIESYSKMTTTTMEDIVTTP